MKTWRTPDLTQHEREAVAAILAMGCGPWEPQGGHYPMGVLDEPETPAAHGKSPARSLDRAGLLVFSVKP